MFPSLVVPDCHTITRAFEKGANFCATEESVFAMMTPMLTAMRANAQAFMKVAASTEAILPDNEALILDDPSTTDQPSSAATSIGPGSGVGDISGTPNTSPDGTPIGMSVDSGVRQSVNALETPDPATVGSGSSQSPSSSGKKAPTGSSPKSANTGQSKAAKQAKNVANMIKKKGKECIPCTFRIDMAADFLKQLWEQIKGIGIKYYEYFKQMLQQLWSLIEFWKGNKYQVDICALKNFFLNYVCIPDFRRIITALMALLINLAMEINGLFDLILMLVAPLLLPFLLAILNPLEQFLLAIIKPLECIIDAMTNQLAKMDFSAIFDMPIPSIKLGPLKKKPDNAVMKSSAVKNPNKDRVFEFNASELFITPLIADQKKEAAQAEEELNAIRAKAKNVDMSDAKARQAYAKELEKARAKQSAARKKLDTNKIQRAQEKAKEMKKAIYDAYAMAIKYIQMAKDKVTEFINMIADEIKKLMDSFMGSNGQMMVKLWDKLQIVQLIAMIVALIDFLRTKPKCDQDKDKEKVLAATAGGISSSSPLSSKTSKVWTDSDGTVHIQEDPNTLSEALDAAIGATGQVPSKNILPTVNAPGTSSSLPNTSPYAVPPRDGSPFAPDVASGVTSAATPNNPLNLTGSISPSSNARPVSVGGVASLPSQYQATPPRAKVIGGVNSSTADGSPIASGGGISGASSPIDATRQRMQSLIELTGDPVVDSSIARAIDAITTPANVQYKCPLQTTVADAEQVNRWIQELNSR